MGWVGGSEPPWVLKKRLTCGLCGGKQRRLVGPSPGGGPLRPPLRLPGAAPDQRHLVGVGRLPRPARPLRQRVRPPQRPGEGPPCARLPADALGTPPQPGRIVNAAEIT